MTCNECQRSLLQLLDPSDPGAELTEHLSACADCRQFQRRLVRIEANVPRLPVPPSQGLAATLRAILEPAEVQPETAPETVPMEPAPATTPIILRGPAGPTPPPRRQVLRARWLLAGLAAAAAGLLIAAVAIFQALNRPQEIPPIAEKPAEEPRHNPLLAELLECDVRLAAAVTPRERTEAIADLAGHLQDAALGKPGQPAAQTLVVLYQHTLENGLVPSAERLPDDDRAPVLGPVLHDFARFREALTRLAPAEVMKKIALAAGRLEELAGKNLPPVQPERKARTFAIDLKRDVPLMQAMVAAAGKLVIEDNPLKRARLAQQLAMEVGKEVKLAVRDRNGPRGIEMGKYLGRLLTHAIADNISLTRRLEPDNKDLNRFAQEVSRQAQAIEAEVRDAPGMQATVQALSLARADVDRSTTGDYRRQ